MAILHDDHKQTLFVSEGGARADWIHFDDSRTPFTVTLGLLTVTLGLLTLHQAEAPVGKPVIVKTTGGWVHHSLLMVVFSDGRKEFVVRF